MLGHNRQICSTEKDEQELRKASEAMLTIEIQDNANKFQSKTKQEKNLGTPKCMLDEFQQSTF